MANQHTTGTISKAWSVGDWIVETSKLRNLVLVRKGWHFEACDCKCLCKLSPFGGHSARKRLQLQQLSIMACEVYMCQPHSCMHGHTGCTIMPSAYLLLVRAAGYSSLPILARCVRLASS